MRFLARISLISLLAVFSFTAHSATAGFISDWSASSGLLPNQIDNPWTLVDSAAPEQPALSAGILTLDTAPASETMYYIQQGSIVDTTQTFFIEARLRLSFGTTFDSARAPIGIGFTTTPNIGNALFIGNDQVFFGASESTTTTKVSVDTNDGFHIYRIEYDGAGGLRLLYDGNQILVASTYTSAGAHGSDPRIYWGDITIAAQGISQYTSFTHNALTVTATPEPSGLAATGLVGVVLWRRTRNWKRKPKKP